MGATPQTSRGRRGCPIGSPAANALFRSVSMCCPHPDIVGRGSPFYSERKRDVHFSANLIDSGQADATVHDGVAVRTNGDQVPDLLSKRSILRHVSRRDFRSAASDAVDLTRWARLFISHPTRLKEGNEFVSQTQDWASIVDRWEPGLGPRADCIPVNEK
jgi:hypothetical protein